MEMEELLAKYFTGEASIGERSFVEKWRSQSETNANTFFEAKMIWLESSKIEETDQTFFERESNEEDPKKGLQVWLMTNQWSKYVAAAILVFAIGLLFVLNQQTGTSNIHTLSDGSEIYLHKIQAEHLLF